jgi:glycosyltransferase involved in cell wall biosynthesis
MKVAYLVNQYPAVSHTFIRREIAALEAKGMVVERFSIRRSEHGLVDEDDIAETGRTTVLLDANAFALILQTLSVLVRNPLRFARALWAATTMGFRSQRGLLRNLGYLVVACQLRDRLARSDCKHVHAHFGTNPAAVARLCALLGGPGFSFTVHGPEEFDNVWAISLREKIQDAEFVVAVSSFGRSQLLRLCAVEQWPKIVVVRCAVDDQYLRIDPPSIPEAPNLVCVGRLCEQKGQHLLVQAAAMARDAGAEFRVVLVGDGELRGSIESLIERLGLSDRFTITGWMAGAEVRAELGRARALVLPSFAEGLPVVIMEALALGRPALTTYIAGIPELVQPGKCGWLVPAGSVDALAEAIQTVSAASAAQLEELGREGRRRVEQMHNARTAVEPLFDEISRCVQRTRG